MAPARPAGLGRVGAAIALLALVGVVVPVWVAGRHGALGIPRSDDWSYLRTLFHWLDTGHLDFNHWVSMTLVGQLVLAAPVAIVSGHDIAAVQVLTALLGLVGLVAALALGQRVVGQLWLAASVALLVALMPLWGALAVSFMTDVPAFAATMVALALGAAALSRRPISMPLVWCSMTASVIGFTIREYAAIPAFAVAVVAGWTLSREGDVRRLARLVLVTTIVAVLALAFVALWRSIPDAKAVRLSVPDGRTIRVLAYKVGGLLRLLGLLLTPALLLVGPGRIVRRSWAASHLVTFLASAYAGAWLVFTATRAPRVAFAGNYVMPNGVLSRDVIVGRRPDILPAGVFGGLVVVGSVGALLLFLACVPAAVGLVARLRRRDLAPRDPARAFLTLALVGYLVAYAAAAATGLPVFDRYLLPVLPVAALLLLHRLGFGPVADAGAATSRPPSVPRLVAAGLALAALAVLALDYTVDSASFDGTRWRVATAATRHGWDRRQVNGGFEWINYHGTQPGLLAQRRTPYCVLLVVDPSARMIATQAVVAAATYRSPGHGTVRVTAFRTHNPCPPPPRPGRP